MAAVYTITGYKADADVWCISCTIDRYGEPEDGGLPVIDREGNEVSPIYLGSEFSYQPCCSGCSAIIHCTVTGRDDWYSW